MKRRKQAQILFYTLVLCTLLCGFIADGLIDKLKEKVFAFENEKINNRLFLHLDKNIYTPNENIWFKAYLLSGNVLSDEVLFVRLTDTSKKIILQKEFPVYDVRSHGDITLPDTLQQGTYHLYAYTDKMINFDPANVFTQEIKVVRNPAAQLIANLAISDSSSLTPGKKVNVNCNLRLDGNVVINARGEYKLLNTANRTLKEGRFSTNEQGLAVFSFNYPELNSGERLVFQAQFTKGDAAVQAKITLPSAKEAFRLNTFVEGGKLIHGLNSKLLLETTDMNNLPVSTEVTVESNQRKIAAVKTNEKGMAVLDFKFDQANKYSFTLLKGKLRQTIDLPLKIEKTGFTMRLLEAGDQITVQLNNQGSVRDAFLVLRSPDEIVYSKPVALMSGDSVLLKIPVNDSLNKLLNVSLFDMTGNLLCERMVYRPKKENYRVRISFDKAGYLTREKVKAKILATDNNGRPVKANLSVGVVARQTLNISTLKTITSELDALEGPLNLHQPEDGDFNDYLITKNWKSGSWSDVLNYKAKGKLMILINTGGVFGYLKSKRKKPGTVKELFLMSKSGIDRVNVDPGGTFSIPAENLVAAQGEKRYLIIGTELAKKYEVHIRSYARDFDEQVTAGKVLQVSRPALLPDKPADQLSLAFSGTNLLKEVKISASRDIAQGVRIYRSSTCNDYVCFNNVLNCRNHPVGGTSPVDGAVYSLNGSPVIYRGCVGQKQDENSILLKNISIPTDFYLPDYALNPISSAELQSTVYWNPNLNTDASGNAEFEFYTSDIRGGFEVIVQGIVTEGIQPIYGRASFDVQRNK